MARRMYRHTRRPASRVVRGESRSHKLITQNRVRLTSIMLCFGFSFTVLAARLIEVSLVGGGDLPFKRLVTEPSLLLQLEESGKQVSDAVSDQPMRRREIVDRNGIVLATNVQTASLVANPSLIRHPQEVALSLAKLLPDLDGIALQQKLSRSDSKFVYLKRHLTPKEQAQVNGLGVPGLFFETQDRRTYPFGDLAAHVVGYVDVDSQGIAGIERSMDRKLKQGMTQSEPLALSMDVRLQSIMYHELSTSMKKFSAIGASGVIMDIRTGEILSMVNLPTFDPHQPAKATPDQLFNRATLGAYEMGSTFKTFTVAMALDSGVVGLKDSYNTANPIKVAGYTISDAHPYERYLSVPEIYAYSSNIGTVQMAMDVGIERQRTFLAALGLTQSLPIELPEKAQPIVPREWSKLASMTVSFGHGISVSPLHLVRAIGSVAGTGRLLQPTLLKASVANASQTSQKRVTHKRIIGEQTARTVRQLMRAVVQYGTAKKADVKGYRVGGKTGTAEKIVGGRYDMDAKIASFVGIFPSDDPRYVVFAMLDEPKGTKETYGFATGGWMAAPVVANVVSRMGPLLGMQPVFEVTDPEMERFWMDADRSNREAQLRPPPAKDVHVAAYRTH